MKKVTFLIPTTLNDGTPVKQGYFKKVEQEILDKIGGYSRDALVSGRWKDSDGATYYDESFRYVVATDQPEILKAIVLKVGRELRQKSMYWEVQESQVEFLEIE